jgi:hypothetical protein
MACVSSEAVVRLVKFSLESALQLTKIMEQPRSEKLDRVRNWSLCRIGRLIGDSLEWPADRRSSSVDPEWVQAAFTRHRQILSRNRLGALTWPEKKTGTQKAPEFACYKNIKVPLSQSGDS